MNPMSEKKRTVRELFDLTGRVAIVAGGAGYLGSEICQGMQQQGARVIVADIDAERASQLVEKLGGTQGERQSIALPLDISREDSIRGLVERVHSDFGRLDILVNATYAPQKKLLDEIAECDFTDSLRGNVSGSFVLAREAKRAMGDRGSIVMFSSMYGRVSPDPRMYDKPLAPNPIEYGVAKAGIEQMIRYLAVAWANEGIRVNGIAPGPFPNLERMQHHPELVERLNQKVPMRRVGQPGEIVGAVVFLVSDAASYVTGHTMVVDGGWTIW
jgi:NAD(P)-dependent dehydrogenase (short-subunit alcohol dehydrogenase family)